MTIEMQVDNSMYQKDGRNVLLFPGVHGSIELKQIRYAYIEYLKNNVGLSLVCVEGSDEESLVDKTLNVNEIGARKLLWGDYLDKELLSELMLLPYYFRKDVENGTFHIQGVDNMECYKKTIEWIIKNRKFVKTDNPSRISKYHEKFDELNDLRSIAMAENTIKAMEKYKTNLAALIFGQNHLNCITSKLITNNVGFTITKAKGKVQPDISSTQHINSLIKNHHANQSILIRIFS